MRIRLLLMAGHILATAALAGPARRYIENGGTVTEPLWEAERSREDCFAHHLTLAVSPPWRLCDGIYAQVTNGTPVELVPPPKENRCGALTWVRVADGTAKGKTGCVSSRSLRDAPAQ